MSYKIVALPGDGIGPEILSGTLELLKLISEKYHFEYQKNRAKTFLVSTKVLVVP